MELVAAFSPVAETDAEGLGPSMALVVVMPGAELGGAYATALAWTERDPLESPWGDSCVGGATVGGWGGGVWPFLASPQK